MNKQDKIKFAVVGCGHIGQRHAAMITNNSECELVALCDIILREISGYAVPFYSSIEEMLGSGTLFDVVTIATPNGMHDEHAIKVLDAGYHVLIEKPMALSVAGCERILTKAAEKKKQVFCVMQNRFSPSAAWLKDILQKKILGDIYMVQVNCYWNRDERYYTANSWHGSKKEDGGTLFTQFSHFVDAIYWLFGDIKNINARFSNFNHKGLIDFEDTGLVSFDLVNGGCGSLSYTTAVRNKNFESSMTIIAQNGTVKISGQYMEELQYCDIKDHEVPVLATASQNNHQFIIANVAEVLKERSGKAIDALDGSKVVEIIERIYAATPGAGN